MKCLKPYLTYLLILVNTLSLSATLNKDSLLQVVGKCGEDTLTVKSLIDLTRIYINSNEYNEALAYAEKALKLSKKLNYKRGVAIAYFSFARINGYQANDTAALFYYNKALKIGEEINDSKLIGNLSNNIGAIYLNSGDNINALLSYLKSIKAFEKIGDKNSQMMPYNNMGNIYMDRVNYKMALNYFLISLTLAKETKNKYNTISALGNISQVYLQTGKYSAALNYANDALKLSEETGEKTRISAFYDLVGTIYLFKSNYLAASQMATKALSTSKAINDKSGIANSNYLLGKIYLKTNDFTRATDCLKQALALSTELNQKYLTRDIYTALCEVYEKTRNYKNALFYNKLYSTLNDSLLNEKNTAKIEELNTEFEVEKKDRKISALNKESNIKTLKIENGRKTNQQLYFLVIGSLFVIAILIISVRLQVKSKKEIALKTEELNKQKVEIARYQSQMNPHFVFNAMSSIQSLIVANDNKQALTQLLAFTKLMRVTLSNSSEDLITLSDEIAFLKQYMVFEQRRFINIIEFNLLIDEGLNVNETFIIPMLLQPFVENAIKHAGLNKIEHAKIEIKIKIKSEAVLEINISDNGNGLKNKESTEHKSKAIKITKERIRLFLTKNNLNKESDFRIENNIHGGVIVKFIIPLVKKY